MWRISNLIFAGALVTAAMVGGVFLLLSTAPGLIAPLPFVVSCLLLVLMVFWLPSRRYASYRYRVTDVSLELRSGIIVRKSVLIPISRVQHLDLHRGPFERRFGLATLQIHTAGTHNATHEIPGLDGGVAHRLREQLAASADLVIR